MSKPNPFAARPPHSKEPCSRLAHPISERNSGSAEPIGRVRPLKIGSLFSGIGALEAGLEAVGVGNVLWQVEADPYCRRVLHRHWPAALRFSDVRFVGAHCLPSVDVICGGFPCQDLSLAGRGAGLAGARSGLWREFLRILRELRPGFAVVENVLALRRRGLDRVLGDLAEAGLDAEWHCLRASDVGAPHRRERLFILAYSPRHRREEPSALRGRRRAKGSDFVSLSEAIILWPTPTASAYGSSQNGCNASRPSGGTASLFTVASREGAPLNPAWVEALMGLPIGWTDLGLPARVRPKPGGSRPAPGQMFLFEGTACAL